MQMNQLDQEKLSASKDNLLARMKAGKKIYQSERKLKSNEDTKRGYDAGREYATLEASYGGLRRLAEVGSEYWENIAFSAFKSEEEAEEAEDRGQGIETMSHEIYCTMRDLDKDDYTTAEPALEFFSGYNLDSLSGFIDGMVAAFNEIESQLN